MTSATAASALDWEVALPQKRSASLDARKPRGTLVINTPDRGEEHIFLPSAVARSLHRRQKSHEIDPQSRAELLYIVGEISHSQARSRIERLIDRREYSSEEIRRKLRDDGYMASTIDACVQRACEVGLVSDARYADSFIRSKVYAGWGMNRIAQELRRRGIDTASLDGWPYEYLDPEEELDRAIALARTRRFSGSQAYQKLVRYLCGRGFAMSVSMRAATRVLQEAEDE